MKNHSPSPVSMELMHECCPQHFCMGTARMKEDNETEECKDRRENMETGEVGMK